MEEVYTTVDMMKRDIHELEKQKYDLIKKNEALRIENENLKKTLSFTIDLIILQLCKYHG